MLDQRINTPAQQRFLSKLMGYDFEVVYYSGKDNKTANALSYLPKNSSNGSHFLGTQLMTLLSPISTCLDTLRERGQQDCNYSC